MKVIKVEDMHCEKCVERITKLLTELIVLELYSGYVVAQLLEAKESKS